MRALPIRLLPILLVALSDAAQASPPSVATLGGRETLLLLEMGRRTYAGSVGSSLEVAYWIEATPEEMDERKAVDAERARCVRIFEAFRVWSEFAQIRRVSITGVAGQAGLEGRLVTETWLMGATAWEHQAHPIRREVIKGQFIGKRGLGYHPKRSGAVAAAHAFMGNWDAGRIHEAWASAAPAFRSEVPLDRLEKSVLALKRIGGQRSRTLLLDVYSVPPMKWDTAPDTVAVRFGTQCANGEGIEDVVVQQAKDGRWQVVGFEPSLPTGMP